MLMPHPQTAKNEGSWRSTKGLRKMATYEVTCEFVVSRTVWVDARHGVEAKELAKAEISEREGIPSDEVGVVDAQREMVTHPYQFDLWREDQDDK